MPKKKKSENETTTPRKTVYELVGGERRPPFRRGIDPLDDILMDEERELSREVKRIRLEQIVMKKRREIERMKQQGGDMDMGSLPSNTDFLNMAKFMADLTPEEAQRVRSAYTFLKLAEKGGGGGMSYLPMLVNYAKQNPGASENQMINYLKLMDSQLLKGLEIAKAMNPNPGKSESEMVNYLKLMDSQLLKGLELAKAMNPNPVKADDNAMKFLTLMKELVIEGVRNPVLQALKETQPGPGVFEQILLNPEMRSAAKEMGMFGGGSEGGAGKTDIDLKIAQITTANQLEIQKINLEWKKSLLEKEAADTKTNALVTALAPFSAIVAGPMSQRMRQFGQQQASTHNPASMPPRVTPMPNTILVQCSCGYQGPTSFSGDKPPATINCPQCGLELNVGDVPIAGKPEETDKRT